MAGWLGWSFHQDRRETPVSPVTQLPAPGPVVEPRPATPEPAPPAQPPVPRGESEAPLAAIFREWSADPSLAGAALGFCVLDGEGASLFESPLARTAMCPASALKTVTTGAAFGLLGPEFRFETTLAATAPVGASGILQGDLVLVGSGDPTLERQDLEKLVDDAVAAGLKRVNGRLLVDASVLPEHPMNDHWCWGDVGNAYGAGAYGLNVDHNRMIVRFDPGTKEGAPAKFLDGAPSSSSTRWESRVRTGAAGSGDRVGVYSEPYGGTITLRGTVPLGEPGFEVTAAIPDPPELAKEVLAARLEKAGVKFADRAINPPVASASRVVLASHRSASLPEIVDHLHLVSDNLESQCLFLTMGRVKQGDPAAVVRKYWEDAGVAFTGLRLLDGSGLARANMIRPLDLAHVNLAARRGPHGQRFFESLASYANGTVRAKLGAMSGVKTEVGFLRLPDGREVTYAVMANGLGPDVDFRTLKARLLETVRTRGF